MSEHKGHIGEDDMQRYLNGEMDAAEQHAFEAKLENDPLAYEAVEGLEGFSQAEVARELQKLQLEAVKAEQSFSWMKIAATVILVLIAGLGIWYYSQPQQSTQLAYEDTTAAAEDKKAAPIPAEPIATPTLTEISSGAVTEVKEEGEIDKEQVVSETPALAELEAIDPPTQKPVDELSTVSNEIAATLEENRASQDEMAVLEEVLEETVMEDIIFEEQVAQDFEIVQDAATDQQLSRTAPAAKSMSRQSFNATTPQPIGGLKAYQRYLNDSLHYTPEMGAGVVNLRFTIDQRGTPTGIQVIQSLNEAADAEAIRLVNDGPKWSDSSAVPMTLSVPINPK